MSTQLGQGQGQGQEQGWQTVVNKKQKQKESKPSEPTKFEPIMAKRQEAKERADSIAAANKQIKYNDPVNKDQDWNQITLTKTKPKPKVVQQQRQASSIKLNEDGEVIQLKKVSPQMSRGIIDGRMGKKWTQIQLAHNSAVDVKTISEIERGGCIYDPNVFNKLCKALGITIERNFILEQK